MLVKIPVMGDSIEGSKTKLLHTYINGEFPHGYMPTVFDSTNVEISIDGSNHDLLLLDSTGMEDYDRQRILLYSQISAVILAYSLSEPSSFESLQKKWYPEAKHFNPDLPIFVVGIDVKDDASQNDNVVLQDQIDKLRKHDPALSFLECNLHNQNEVNQLFESITRQIISPEQKIKPKLTVGRPQVLRQQSFNLKPNKSAEMNSEEYLQLGSYKEKIYLNLVLLESKLNSDQTHYVTTCKSRLNEVLLSSDVPPYSLLYMADDLLQLRNALGPVKKIKSFIIGSPTLAKIDELLSVLTTLVKHFVPKDDYYEMCLKNLVEKKAFEVLMSSPASVVAKGSTFFNSMQFNVKDLAISLQEGADLNSNDNNETKMRSFVKGGN